MNAVLQVGVSADEDGIRVDRWFKRRFPQLTHGRLEKMLRTGQVRVDGARVKANDRLASGQVIRVPPMPDAGVSEARPRTKRATSEADAAMLRGAVMHKDNSIIVLNKPSGLAVQGGTKTEKHIDGMLDVLTFDASERPRLVHRLDRDTSGVLVLARTAKAAASLAKSFKTKDARKIYWALVVGVPEMRQGTIRLALSKQGGAGHERVMPAEEGDEDAKHAVTHYTVMETASHKLSWVAFMPMTGRTHQIRAHAAYLGTPIVGDGKYGGADAHPGGEIEKALHLHARSLDISHPEGQRFFIKAPLPPHMLKAWKLFGFNPDDKSHPFAELEA
ncbi:MAG: RluA family pseudouridine synthase [Parvibaculum sp.]